jgi:2-iminobutanoate/2-iminopropanoate deaminase
MARREVATTQAPTPAGPYSQAVRSGSVVAVAGQVGIDPATGAVAGDDVAAQTRQALANVAAVLAAAGLGLDEVVRVDVFLASMDDFAAMNEAYADVFAPPYPARTTLGVSLPAGLLVEITALAVESGGRA